MFPVDSADYADYVDQFSTEEHTPRVTKQFSLEINVKRKSSFSCVIMKIIKIKTKSKQTDSMSPSQLKCEEKIVHS